MKDKFTTYTFTQRKGMEGVGDMEENAFTPEAIAAQQERIKQLKESGEYGQEYTLNISIEHDPTFDKYVAGYDPYQGNSTSYGFTVVDLSAPPKEIKWTREAKEHWDKVNLSENIESWRKNSNLYDK